MKSFFTYIFLLLFVNGFSQISITKNDMPSVGDKIVYSESSVQGLNFNQNKTGANQQWDYSNLAPTSQGIYNYVSSLSTPYLAYFFNTIGIKTQDTLNLGIVKFSDIYDFYKKTDSKYSIVGRGFSYQSLPLPANFDVEDKIYNFPLKFGDKDSTPFYFKLTDPTGTLPFRYAQTGWRVTVVDGWGNISTPYGSFSCIRVKTKLYTTDTITISGFSIPIKRTSFEYRWLTNGEKIPLLQINGTETFGSFIPTQVIYRDIPRELKPVADYTYTDTKGEPGYEITFNDISKNNPTEWIWSISPNTYTYMWGTNAGSPTVNVRFDSVGVYDVSLKVSNKGGISEKIRNQLINIAPAVKNGLPSSMSEQLNMYPNPVADKIHFNLQYSIFPSIIEIYTIDGKLLKSYTSFNQHEVFDLSDFKAGQYLVKLTQGNKQMVKLITKL